MTTSYRHLGPGYRKGPILLRGNQIPGETSDKRLLDKSESADWVHQDPGVCCAFKVSSSKGLVPWLN